MSFHIMKSYTIKLQKPGTKLEKETEELSNQIKEYLINYKWKNF